MAFPVFEIIVKNGLGRPQPQLRFFVPGFPLAGVWEVDRGMGGVGWGWEVSISQEGGIGMGWGG